MSRLLRDLHPQALHVMTWNIRRRIPLGGGRRADRWEIRRPRLQALVSTEKPTLLAAQEVLPDQECAILQALGDSHRVIGLGRERDGTGEGCPVFYDASRLELLGWRQRALSETPERPGSISWGNLFPRISLHADFLDRRTQTRFHLINTHLDPLSARSRRHCAAALREAAAASALPCLITGDFNAGPASDTLREFFRHGTLLDSWLAAEKRLSPEYATYASYRPARTGLRIDGILTTPGIRVERVGINSATVDGGWASDHLPVQAGLILPRPGPSGLSTHESSAHDSPAPDSPASYSPAYRPGAPGPGEAGTSAPHLPPANEGT